MSESVMLSVRVIRALVRAAEACGVPRATLVAEAKRCGVDLDAADARVSRAQAQRLCAFVMDRSGDRALGLRMGAKMGGYDLNPLAGLVAHAPTLREGLASLTRFHAVLSDHRSVTVVEDAQRVTICCEPFKHESARFQRFTTEALMVALYQLVRKFAGGVEGIECVAFEYVAPPDRAEYARVFRGSERFEQPFTGLVFKRALMDAPSPHADRGLHGSLRELAERKIARAGQHSVALQVRDFLVRQAPNVRTSAEAAARGVGLSERSLRRRLAEEQTSYTAVANQARGLIAGCLLVEGERSIRETASEMGFADVRAFHRAFKNWTGTTPRAYRETRLRRSEAHI